VSFDHWNTRADAVTMVDGIALRVPGGIPGETADVEVIAQSRGGPVAWARLIDITSPSPDRREPPCALEGTCGGCGLQHVDGGRFARVVESALREAPELAAVLAPPERWIHSAPWGWRHKAVLLPARRKGALQLGGYARGSHDVVDLPSCGVLAPGLRHARAGLLARLGVHRKLPLSPPGDAVKPGALRSLILRGARDGRVLATAVVSAPNLLVQRALTDAVAAGEIAGAFEQVHDAPGDAVQGPGPARHLAGEEALTETIADVALPLLPLAFFQVNPGVLEHMVVALRDAIGAADRIVDAYCGVGALGLAVAAGIGTGTVTGCDVVPSAIAAATDAAGALGIVAEYHQGRPEDLDPPAEDDVVLLDPPRKGCSAAALRVLGTARRLVYVSCGTSSFIRDARRLMEAGYRPVEILPAEMLPYTPHVEWIARFERA